MISTHELSNWALHYYSVGMIELKENPSASAFGIRSGSHLNDISDPVGVVCISRLKTFAAESLPAGSPLREILLSDKDHLSVGEFLAKIGVWLRLLNWRQGAGPGNMGPTGSTCKKRGEADERGNIR